jgi:hypothetical protein
MCLKKYLIGKLYILGTYSMIPQHIAIVWVKYKSLSSFDGVRSFFLSDEDFVGSVKTDKTSKKKSSMRNLSWITFLCFLGLVDQLEDRCLCKAEALGSNPSKSIFMHLII